MTTLRTMRREVAATAAQLDKVVPDWAYGIHLERFEADSLHGVLTQLFRVVTLDDMRNSEALRRLACPAESYLWGEKGSRETVKAWAAKKMFFPSFVIDEKEQRDLLSTLTGLWMLEITKRLAPEMVT